jgi:hypothetical protein
VWLSSLAVVSLILGAICALAIALDLLTGHPQKMGIMNLVWPITALWSGPLGLWAYFRYGRAASKPVAMNAQKRGEKPPAKAQPFPVLAAKGTTHCGAGCTLGDIVAGGLSVFAPLAFFGHRIFGEWVYAYVLAFIFGIAFQYFTIKPMKGLSPGRGLLAALKADALSLSAWQVGMYAWMAIATFAIFHHELEKSKPVFWFMMQVAMLVGFATSYPVNWWLIRKGVKEAM